MTYILIKHELEINDVFRKNFDLFKKINELIKKYPKMYELHISDNVLVYKWFEEEDE